MQRCARTRRKCAHSCQKKFVCPFVGLNCGCVPPCENMCVRSLGYLVGASPPPCENMCVRSLGYIVGASPPLQYLDSILNWIFNPILNPILKPNIDCPLPNKCFPVHPKKLFTAPKFTCSGRIFRVAVFFILILTLSLQ